MPTTALTRRAALASVAAAALSAIARPVSAQTPPSLTWAPATLTPGEARTLDAMAEAIIPRTDTPGARDAGVPAYIDRLMGFYYSPATVAVLRAGLARMDKDAGGAFADLKPDAQKALLERYDAEAQRAFDARPAHFFLTFKQLVLIGYFSSKPGATVTLKYDQIPGAYHGVVPYAQIGRAWAT